jgi:hypothetical protein
MCRGQQEGRDGVVTGCTGLARTSSVQSVFLGAVDGIREAAEEVREELGRSMANWTVWQTACCTVVATCYTEPGPHARYRRPRATPPATPAPSLHCTAATVVFHDRSRALLASEPLLLLQGIVDRRLDHSLVLAF